MEESKLILPTLPGAPSNIVTAPAGPPGDEDVEARFKALASEWKAATVLYSSVRDTVLHLAYQKIIGMGQAAIPLILRDMVDNGPNHWFWALRVITDENPATKEMAGDMVAMTEAWIQWGKNKGYL